MRQTNGGRICLLAALLGACLLFSRLGVALCAVNDTNGEVYRALKATIKSVERKGAKVGFLLMDMETGKAIYSHKAEKSLVPASTMKLLTSAAILHYLGPDFRFSTKFFAKTGVDRNGVVASDLYIVGEGDPLLLEEELLDLARQLYAKGVRRIDGDIVIDNSYFEGEKNIWGWKRKTDFSCSEPLIGATSVNFNILYIQIKPPFIVGEKPLLDITPYELVYRLVNNIIVMPGVPTNIELTLANDTLTVAGVINARERNTITRCINIQNSDLFAGLTIAEYLKKVGITIGGKVTTGERPPDFYRLILEWQGKTISAIISPMNKRSNNFMAEQLFKALGAKLFGAPGTWEKGSAAIEKFLDQELGRKTGYRIINGSGLSRESLLSAGLLVDLLHYTWKNHIYAHALIPSLPLMGVDGTLKKMNSNSHLLERVYAKTGSLDNVHTLAGYLLTNENRTLAFALLINQRPSAPINFQQTAERILVSATQVVIANED